ncbi:MAG: RNA 2',3'-cyclic phosphodiesterase [Anaerolineae bacterium]|nr:RNA 2',3'-cyclic phosphodiesterase [Anaerolineae bacterium]
MTDMLRLFIAIELPPNVLSLLSGIQTQIKERVPPRTVRWVNPDGIHLTLKFLGDVPAIRQHTLEQALIDVTRSHTAFELAAGGLGCFPNTRRPRVVWVGVQEQTGALHALRDAIEAHFSPLGFPTEQRPFNPHLTLGRVRREATKHNTAELGTLVANIPPGDTQRWRADAVSLIRSQLKPTGAVYTELVRAPLRQPD